MFSWRSIYYMNSKDENIGRNQFPRVTFALFAYNHEEFISEAIEAAFAQTYSNLEIIISDDKSIDSTPEIVASMISEYQGGHDVTVCLREKNVGWARHVNDVMTEATGALVVMAAGDDVSDPKRVEILVEKWLAEGCPSGVASGMSFISADGSYLHGTPTWLREQGQRLRGATCESLLETHLGTARVRFTGCSAAWSKDNWNFFGPLDDVVTAEDEVFSFRSCLRGGVAFVDQELVKYRQHDSNLWNVDRQKNWTSYRDVITDEEGHAIRCGYAVLSCRAMLTDLSRFRESLAAAVYEKLRDALKLRLEQASLREKWWSMSLSARLCNLKIFSQRSWMHRLACLLPLKLYAHLRYTLHKGLR